VSASPFTGVPPLAGAFDTHIHAAPDAVVRRQDFFAVAESARLMGMAGIVFKDVGQTTMDRAHAVESRVGGLRAFGGLVLDLPAGGLNPHAARAALERGARIIWMPVVDARETVERYRAGAVRLTVPPRLDPSDALTVFDSAWRLAPAVREIVTMVAAYDAVLATGHLSSRESLELLAYAASRGVRRMLVNHPVAPVVDASTDEQRELAGLGALLEHCFAQTTPALDALPIRRIADAIRHVGPQHCVVASDLGQVGNPPAPEGLAAFRAALLDEGFGPDELDTMLIHNPRALLL
jgi:hypothetical protein